MIIENGYSYLFGFAQRANRLTQFIIEDFLPLNHTSFDSSKCIFFFVNILTSEETNCMALSIRVACVVFNCSFLG